MAHSTALGASLCVTAASQPDSGHQSRSQEKSKVPISPELLAYVSNDRGLLSCLLCMLDLPQTKGKANSAQGSPPVQSQVLIL